VQTNYSGEEKKVEQIKKQNGATGPSKTKKKRDETSAGKPTKGKVGREKMKT